MRDINRIKLVSNIVLSSKSPKIFFGIFLTILLVLSISIGAYLFTANLINSYKVKLQTSYLGFSPRYTLESDSTKFLINAEKLFLKNGYNASLKEIVKDTFTIKINNKKIKKRLTFFIFKDGYIDKRFAKYTSISNGIYINDIVQNILKDTKKLSIQKDKKISLDINSFDIISTGFLTDEAIIFIDKSKVKDLVKDLRVVTTLEVDQDVDKVTKNQIASLTNEIEVYSLKWSDRLNSEKSAYENFTIFNTAKDIFMIILMLNIIVIILVIQNILLELKQKSFAIILKMGMGLKEVIFVFIFFSIVLFVLASLLGYLILTLLQYYYLNITNFNEEFFIPLQMSDYITLIYSMILLILSTILINIFILKGTK